MYTREKSYLYIVVGDDILGENQAMRTRTRMNKREDKIKQKIGHGVTEWSTGMTRTVTYNNLKLPLLSLI